jgi:phenylacetyl-CoA:acceptor oxidoreductase subunit 1
MASKLLKRRDFLKMLIAGAGTIAGLQIFQNVQSKAFRAMAAGPVGESKHRWAMVIDQSKCTGCGYCTNACRAHNDVPPEISWNRVIQTGKVGEKDVFLARPCMQCQHAPCVEVCPVSASYYRADGIVMMDYDKCIGCRYCEVACPYDARRFNWEARSDVNPYVPTWGEPEVERRPRGVVEKCTFCIQRIDSGLAKGLMPGEDYEATPACVNVCPVGARVFGDLKDPTSRIAQVIAASPTFRLRQELGTEPSVYYIPPAEGL